MDGVVHNNQQNCAGWALACGAPNQRDNTDWFKPPPGKTATDMLTTAGCKAIKKGASCDETKKEIKVYLGEWEEKGDYYFHVAREEIDKDKNGSTVWTHKPGDRNVTTTPDPYLGTVLIRLRNKSGYNRAGSTVGWRCQARTCQQTG